MSILVPAVCESSIERSLPLDSVIQPRRASPSSSYASLPVHMMGYLTNGPAFFFFQFAHFSRSIFWRFQPCSLVPGGFSIFLTNDYPSILSFRGSPPVCSGDEGSPHTRQHLFLHRRMSLMIPPMVPFCTNPVF